jgi:hypothetical protein
MDSRAEIREALRDMVREMLLDGALQCTVKSVDKQAGTIVATSLKEEVDYFHVRLKAVLVDGNGRGILAYPMVGSMVSIVLLDGIDTMAFVSQLSDIESFTLAVDNGVSLELTKNGAILLNGDNLDGLVKVGELVKKINQLESTVNQLSILMATHGHLLVTPAGAPLPIAVAAPLGTGPGPLTPTVQSELENPNVKHG